MVPTLRGSKGEKGPRQKLVMLLAARRKSRNTEDAYADICRVARECVSAGLFVWMHHITCMCVSIVKSWETRPVFAPLCGFFARRLTGHQQPQREGISRTTGLVGLPIRVIRVSRWDEVGGQDER